MTFKQAWITLTIKRERSLGSMPFPTYLFFFIFLHVLPQQRCLRFEYKRELVERRKTTKIQQLSPVTHGFMDLTIWTSARAETTRDEGVVGLPRNVFTEV